jgi:hypothetical protein
MSIRTGIFAFSHYADTWTERIDIETKAGRQVLKWAPVEDDAVPEDQRRDHGFRRRKAGMAMATVRAFLGGMR